MSVTPTVSRGRPPAMKNVGTVTSLTGLTLAGEFGDDIVRTTILTLTNVNIAITRNGTTAAFGSQVLYTFPLGVVTVLGTIANLTITRGETTNMTATAPLVAGLGTVAAANDATLSGTEVDLGPSTAFTLVAGTKAGGFTLAAPVTINGSTTGASGVARRCILNITSNNATDGAVATGNSSVNVSGTVTITWVHQGNY